jgi:hypothetical protein
MVPMVKTSVMTKNDEPTTARRTPMSRTFAETLLLLARAYKEFDQQCAADIESLVHVRVHVHALAGDVAQDGPKPLGA